MDGTTRYVGALGCGLLSDLDPPGTRPFQVKTASHRSNMTDVAITADAPAKSSGDTFPSALCGRSAL
jgi:hypothetical protein